MWVLVVLETPSGVKNLAAKITSQKEELVTGE